MANFVGTSGSDSFSGANENNTFTTGGGGIDLFQGGSQGDVFIVDRAAQNLYYSFSGKVSINGGQGRDVIDITDFVTDRGAAGLSFRTDNGLLVIRTDEGSEIEIDGIDNAVRNGDGFTFRYGGTSVAIDGDIGLYEGLIKSLVSGTPRAPVAVVPTALTTDEGSLLIRSLDKDIQDQDGDNVFFSIKRQPQSGQVEIGSFNRLEYRPEANNLADVSFDIEAFDGTIARTITYTVTHRAVNDPPFAFSDAVQLPKGKDSLVIDVLANDSDPEGGALQLTDVLDAPNVTIQADGKLLYARDPAITGIDSFTYRVEDEQGASSIGSVTVAIDAPLAVDDAVTAGAKKLVKGLTIAVLANDTSAAGKKGLDIDSIRVIEPQEHGNITLVRGAKAVKVKYFANDSFDGQDSFTYTVADKAGLVSNVASVVISGPDLTIP